MKIDLEELRQLIEMLEQSSLTELEVKTEDGRIRLSKTASLAQATTVVAAQPAAQPTASAEKTEAEDQDTFVTSPFVGTFYLAPSPESEPFVRVGDSVVPGQVLCIVEAMKLMNEIESDIAGRIVEVLVENGKPVEFGDRLFRVETA